MNCCSFRSERGSIITTFALFATLIVLFAIGYAIDLPTVQSASIRAQHALDIGAAHGIHGFHSYQNAIATALGHASSVMENSYGEGSGGSFSNTLTGNPSTRVWVPRFNTVSVNAPGAISGFPDSALTEENIRLLSLVFDPPGIDDFKNAVTVYAKFTPYRYLPLVDNTEIEITSLAMIKTVLSYVLIDPAFSVDDRNFYHLFGRESIDEATWPMAALARAHDGRVPTFPWEYPLHSGLFKQDPVGGPPFSRGGQPPANSTDPNYSQSVYEFYASLCDTLPFVNYKASATDLIDWFTASSAFNSTTYVGLTGYESAHPLVPIHPVTVESGVAVHPKEPSGFPLAKHPQLENRGLHQRKRNAFQGYINSLDPNVYANRGAGVDGIVGNSDDSRYGTGLNRWDLCFCRGLYMESFLGDTRTQYVLSEDLSFVEGDELELHHPFAEQRQRSQEASNWCDDERANIGGTTLRDMTVNLELSQSGRGQNSTGETPRNIVSGLAIRVVNPELGGIMSPPPNQWRKPNPPPPSTDPFHGTPSSLATGERNLPLGMREATRALVQAKLDYSRDPDYGIKRPIGKTALIVFGFGVWSKTTATTYGFDRGLSLTQAESDLKRTFTEALAEALCDEQISVILNFLPMDDYDRNTVLATRESIQEFERIYQANQQGGNASTEATPILASLGLEDRCNSRAHPIAPVYFFITDYQQFDNNAGGSSEDVRDYEKKLKASFVFRSTAVNNITNVLIEHTYPL